MQGEAVADGLLSGNLTLVCPFVTSLLTISLAQFSLLSVAEALSYLSQDRKLEGLL